MNILIYKFPYSSNFGGQEKNLIELVENLKARGTNFYLVSSDPVLLEQFKKRNWFAKKLWAGVEPVYPAGLLLFVLTSIYALPRLILNLLYYKIFKKIDALYCLSLSEKILITPWARLLGIKVFWAEHTQIDRWLTRNPYRLFFWLWSYWAQLITISNAIKFQLIEELGINKNRIQTIYPGLDIEDYTSQKPLVISVAEEKLLEQLKNKFVIGAVCRLSKEKGINFLLQAINLLKKNIPNICCVIVGDGPERKNLEFLAKTLDISELVIFTGFKKNLDPYYHAFDLLAMPSAQKEAFGIVVVEAMAHGLPVIASESGGLMEIITDKQTGYLIPATNSEELARAINYIYQNPEEANQIGLAAQEMIIKRFTKEKMVEEFDQAFKN